MKNSCKALIAIGVCGVSLASNARAEEWGGPYVGVAASDSRYAVTGTSTKADGTPSASATTEAANLQQQANGASLYGGRRYSTSGNMLFGWESDLMLPGHQALFVNVTNTGQPSAALRYKLPWLVTLRITAAWPAGDWLFFGSAGAAVAQQDLERTQFQLNTGTGLTEPRFTETDRSTTWGTAWGIGAEWRVGKRLALRAEHLVTKFAAETYVLDDTRGGAQASFNSVQGRIAHNTSEIGLTRIGLTYVFGR